MENSSIVNNFIRFRKTTIAVGWLAIVYLLDRMQENIAFYNHLHNVINLSGKKINYIYTQIDQSVSRKKIFSASIGKKKIINK